MKFTNVVLVLMMLLPTVSFASDTDELKGGSGNQILRGELAAALYKSVGVKAVPVRILSPNGAEGGRGPMTYTKIIGEINCSVDMGGTVFCGAMGQQWFEIKGDQRFLRKLYDALITTILPGGLNQYGEGTISGYGKTVAGVSCDRVVADGTYFCNIRFRQ